VPEYCRSTPTECVPFAFGRPDEGGRTLDAEEGDLFLEGVGHVLRSVIVPDGQSAGDGLGKPAEMLPHALADRLQRLEAGGPCVGVDPDAFGGAVIDGDEHRRPTLGGDRGGQIGAPHRVHGRGDDGAVVAARSAWRADPRRREQIVLFSRINRSTRRKAVRMPPWRSRAQTLR